MSSRKKERLEVILTERALSDLCEIEDFSIQKWGRKTTDRYLDDLQSALVRLVENPAILRLEPDLSPGLYFYRVRQHFFVCDVGENFIGVLTLIHTSMDLPTRLAELEPRLIAEANMLRKKR